MLSAENELTLTAGLFLGELLLVYVGFAWIRGVFEEDKQRDAARGAAIEDKNTK